MLDKMEIYQKLGINNLEDVNFPTGTIGFPYVIKSAEIIEKKQ